MASAVDDSNPWAQPAGADLEVGSGGAAAGTGAAAAGTTGQAQSSGTPATGEAGGKKGGKGIKTWTTGKMLMMLRTLNLCNGALLILAGVLVFIVGLANITFTTVTVSCYVILFGFILSCLECNISNIAPKFRRNFGFMFSFYGRTLFILFCATMLFAMNVWLGWLIGIVTALNGIFNGYVICVHPAFKGGELSGKGDPYGGYTGGETVMLKYLQKNPQLTQSAASAAANFASQNPAQAMQIAQAVGNAKAAEGRAGEGASQWG